MNDVSLSPILVIRMLCGIWFIPHIVAKLRDVGFAAQIFEKAGFRPAHFFVYFTVLLEAIAAFGLVFGIYPKMAAVMASTILLGAAFTTVKVGGLNWPWHRFGMEYLLFWMLVCVLSAWAG